MDFVESTDSNNRSLSETCLRLRHRKVVTQIVTSLVQSYEIPFSTKMGTAVATPETVFNTQDFIGFPT